MEAEEQKRRLSPVLAFRPGHGDLLGCWRRKSFRGVPHSFFAIHITAALVLFMTDGMTVSLPSSPRLRLRAAGEDGGSKVS